MIKKIMLLATVFVVYFSSMCFASNGGLLTSEEKIAEQAIDCIAGQADYTELAKNFTDGLAKNLPASKFVELKKTVKEQLGSLSNSKLAILQKFDKADRVIYLANGSKTKNVEVAFVFETSGKKPLLNEITMRPVEMKPVADKK
jgi:hypothetical protein